MHNRRFSLRAVLAAAALLVPFAAAPARAQVALIPDNNMSGEQMRFRAEAMQLATETLNAWRTAWEADDVRALMRLYQRDALLVLPGVGTPSQGARAIEQALQSGLPRMGKVELATVDAAVDDHLLYIYQKFVVEPGTDAGAAGTATLVMQREGSRWKIRAQIFSPEPALAVSGNAATPAQAADTQ